MRLWIFGGSGMLGSHVVNAAKERGYEVFAPSHEACDIADHQSVGDLFALAQAKQPCGPRVPDAVINCAGALPGANPRKMILANALGPYNLAGLGIRLIHMSTDCVFSGRKRGIVNGGYLGNDEPTDPVDIYGRTKLAGEPLGDHVLVVRGSFVGLEHGFFSWVATADKGKAKTRLTAWIGAIWNGSSVQHMAKVLVDCAEGKQVGVIHAAAEQFVSKAWMVEYIVDKLDLRFSIELVPEPVIWRALWPDIILPPVKQSLDELCEVILNDQ